MTKGKKNHFSGGISMLKWYYTYTRIEPRPKKLEKQYCGSRGYENNRQGSGIMNHQIDLPILRLC
jgi:hypothetical protein